MDINDTIPERDLPVVSPGPNDYLRGTRRSDGKSALFFLPEISAAAAAIGGALDAVVADAAEEASSVLQGLGYLVPVPYAAGITVNNSRLTVSYGSNVYAPVPSAMPFTTGASFDASKWRLVQGVSGPDLSAPTGAAMVGFRQTSAAQARPLDGKVRELGIGVGDFTALQDAINAAPLGGEVLIPAGTTVAVTSLPDNKSGVRMRGQGKVMKTDAYSGQEQINSYRDTRPVATGKEYLWAVYNVMQATNRAIRCYTYGDSTVEGGLNFIDWNFFLQELLPDLVASRGVRNFFSVTNRGVGGSNLSTWNPGPDIGANSSTPADLVILKCGINDGSFPIGTRLDTFRTNLRAGLATIRGISGGDVGGTAILIVGPNATIDKQNHTRTAEWYEQLRGIFDSACADYRCAYFDAYQYLNDTGARDDSMWARQRWLDAAESSGQKPVSLHPRNVAQAWLWGAIVDWMFGESEIMRWSSNGYVVRSAYYGHPYAKQPPDFYPVNYDSGVTIEVARTQEGFPITGILTTTNVDGLLVQSLTQSATGGLTITRSATISDNYWSAWTGIAVAIGSNGSSFANNWANFGSIYGGVRAALSPGGVVTFDGRMKPGTTAAGTTSLTLPTGMWPGNQRTIAAPSDVGMVVFDITSGGQLNIMSGSPASWVSLTGISFRR
ncbi:GDSL-type esterase/lipase family protein [Pseudoxanthomonas sp. USHLN014]|uniref:SGNH/GDSL hydrolase family protein n=1 Tax=Pseudoxanthomonas sp. USHLN014 TaxID=3081297 RepID=UPI00301B89B1